MTDRRAQSDPTGAADNTADGTDRPRLAIAVDGRSTSPMDLVATLGELAQVVWVVDPDDPTLGAMGRLLPRLGPVVDRRGLDADATAEALRSTVGPIDGVIAYSDAQLAVAAGLAGSLGLPGNSAACVERLNDKHRQRAALAAGGLPTPGVVRVGGDVGADGIGDLVAHLRFPLVLKPARGDSSSDVLRVDGADELIAAFSAPPLVGRDAEHVVVVEEYLSDPPDPGRTVAPYVSVESIVVDGVHRALAISGRFPLAEPFRETGDFMPHVLEPDEARAVIEVAAAAASALGVTSGALHTEIKLTASGPVVIEVNGRVAGGGINLVYAARHGVPLSVLAARVALGLDVDAPEVSTDRSDGPFTYHYFLQPPASASRLVSVGRPSDLVGTAGIEAVHLNRSPGDELDWRIGSQGYVMRVVGTAPDRDTLAAVPESVVELVDVVYE